MKTIPINSRRGVIAFAKVDDDDFCKVSKYPWHFNSGGYQQTSLLYKRNGKNGSLMMHKLIMGNGPKGMVLDHINRDKLDNRKENLRWATPSQNRANAGPFRTSKTGVKGVHPGKRGRYRAQICNNGKIRSLGEFNTIDEAAIAYRNAAISTFGKFASF